MKKKELKKKKEKKTNKNKQTKRRNIRRFKPPCKSIVTKTHVGQGNYIKYSYKFRYLSDNLVDVKRSRLSSISSHTITFCNQKNCRCKMRKKLRHLNVSPTTRHRIFTMTKKSRVDMPSKIMLFTLYLTRP